MTATVTSKFRNSLWIAPILLGVLVAILTVVVVNLSEEDYSPSNAQVIMASLATMIILVCYKTYRAVKRFIKVTVSPDALLLHYLLINNKITIDYADILHVSVVNESRYFYGIEMMRSFSLVDTTKLKIELRNGKKIYLVEEYYENFDELTEAVRRARFKLD
jgi:hypothetical protein